MKYVKINNRNSGINDKEKYTIFKIEMNTIRIIYFKIFIKEK